MTTRAVDPKPRECEPETLERIEMCRERKEEQLARARKAGLLPDGPDDRQGPASREAA